MYKHIQCYKYWIYLPSDDCHYTESFIFFLAPVSRILSIWMSHAKCCIEL